MADGRGTIITFYSYKGGTGRSMALANVAWILAAAGRRVLAIDWDFEAPGLHRYFRPFLIDQELASTRGLIDFFWSYAAAAMTPPPEGERADHSWWDRMSDLDQFTVQLDWAFPGDGCLDLVAAGQQDADYADRVTGFDWTKFYRRLNGEVLLDSLRERLKRDYDFVLVDSRTGVSDTSGISTIAMPDRLVAMCTLNRQSIDGVAAVLSSIVPQRKDRSLTIFPVVSRVELAEKDRLDAARKRARSVFNDFVPGRLEGSELLDYWNDMEVLYQPYYAYEEVLAPFGDPSGEARSPSSMLASMERVAQRVTGLARLATPVVTERQRLTIVRQYAGGDPTTIAAPAVAEDTEERRARAENYLFKDLGDPASRFSTKARFASQSSGAATAVVLASAVAVPIFMAFGAGAWPSPASTTSLTIIALSAATVLCKFAELRMDNFSSYKQPLRACTAATLFANLGMNLWVVSMGGGFIGTAAAATAATTEVSRSPDLYPKMVVILLGFAILAHLFDAIGGLREISWRLRQISDLIQQEQRLYINSAGEYTGRTASEAWRQFVERVEDLVRHANPPAND